jgi:hypothetical protein
MISATQAAVQGQRGLLLSAAFECQYGNAPRPNAAHFRINVQIAPQSSTPR